jgi:hypothetical protein
MQAIGGALAFVAIMVFGVAQFVAGYAGIQHSWGTGWACAAIIVGFLFRFTLPITLGAFFGAMNVWHWHWLLAAVFALPGLLFLIPGAIVGVAGLIKR